MTPQTYHQKFSAILRKSGLNHREQAEFSEVFQYASEDILMDITELGTADPFWMRKLYDNYRLKKECMNEKNIATWQDILQKEYQDIHLLESQDY